MIVICTKCEAKFRIPDDRVGPRGANVRCSRCKNVFLAPPAPAAVAGAPGGLDLEGPAGSAAAAGRGERPSPPRFDPFAAEPTRPPAGPPPLPPPLPGAEPGSSFVEDPFGLASVAVPDPFAAPAEGGAGDPFAAPDPFAPAARPPVGPAVAVADPADLLSFASGGEGTAEPAPEVTAGGLALEEPQRPPPMPALRPGGAGADLLGFDPGFEPVHDAPGAAPEELDGLFGREEPLALAGEPTPDRADPFAVVAAPSLPSAAAAPAPPPPAAPPPEPEPRIPGARGARVRAAVVNALALAALLGAAVAILAVWRAEGPLGAAALRPAALLAALRGGGSAGAFSTRGVRSGLYERERGAPILFVRGEIVSRAPAPVARVKVAVEVVRDGRVIARGEALAGAVPTPEALHGAADAAALAAAAREAAAGAPDRVAPGEAVPFLVAIADHPADLGGTSLRIEVAPDRGP